MSSSSAHDPGPVTTPPDPHHALPAGNASRVTDPGHMLPAGTADAPAGGRWLRRLIVLGLLLAVIAFVAWRILGNKKETEATNSRTAQASNRPTPVLVSAVQQKTVPVYLTALGTVTPYNTVTLHSRVDGQLLKVNFQEGQTVHEHQLLLQIDPRPYQAALDQAKGTLTKDIAAQKLAQDQANRYTQLYQAGVVSKEQQQTQVSTAGQAAGSIDADNAAIEAAKVNLGYTSIYSPINGVVGLRQVDPGNIVHASDSTGLVTITQVHPIAVIFTLPEDQIPQAVQAMKKSRLTVEAYDRSDSHKIAEGKLLTIDNQIDTTTGTAKLKAVFDNSDDSLFPNQFVNVRLIIEQRQNAIVVPAAAIQTGTQGNFVFVVRDGAGKAPAGGRRGGGKGKGGNAGADSSAGAPAPASEATAGSGGGRGRGGRGAGGDGQQPQGPPKHVEMATVKVDLTQGSNVILAPGTVHAGDLVVIDGQEKLTDQSNVQPQMGKPSGQAPPNGVGAGAASGTTNPDHGGQPNAGQPAPAGAANSGGSKQ